MDSKISFKISGMHCTSCAFNIDGELEDLPGVKEAVTSYSHSQTTVVFDGEKISETELELTIKKLGYDTTRITS